MSDHEPAHTIPRPVEAPVGFAARLREEMKLVHREAERTGFIAELIRGRANRLGYALFLRNLVPVYTALEASLAAAPSVPLLGAFRVRALRRLPALEQDLKAIEATVGPEGGALLENALPEAQVYAQAIRRAAADGPPRLAAHAYARYLGDLSGGQILKPILARSLELDPGMLRFYDFPEVPDADIAKTSMRDALDALAPDGRDADSICDEAIAAFRHNIALSFAVCHARAIVD